MHVQQRTHQWCIHVHAHGIRNLHLNETKLYNAQQHEITCQAWCLLHFWVLKLGSVWLSF